VLQRRWLRRPASTHPFKAAFDHSFDAAVAATAAAAIAADEQIMVVALAGCATPPVNRLGV